MTHSLFRRLMTTAGILVVAGLLSHAALAEKPAADAASKKFAPGAGMIKALDTDGDGKVSAAEFNKKSEERFAEMDGNKDGFLTEDEMAAHQKKMMERARAMQEKAREQMKNTTTDTEKAPQ